MYPVQVSQEFVDAVNARDVDRVVGCFNTDAVIQSDAGHVIAQGEKAIRTHFGQFIAQSPTLHVEISTRIHLGSWVVGRSTRPGSFSRSQSPTSASLSPTACRTARSSEP
jgi:hypothetical protein